MTGLRISSEWKAEVLLFIGSTRPVVDHHVDAY